DHLSFFGLLYNAIQNAVAEIQNLKVTKVKRKGKKCIANFKWTAPSSVSDPTYVVRIEERSSGKGKKKKNVRLKSSSKPKLRYRTTCGKNGNFSVKLDGATQYSSKKKYKLKAK
ncbi:MAG: hypothetical protein KDD53_07315, partial [Bdellovibrionales bacterium]|nr:hypothetical protein [Bdellovibrionales bacterium]